MRASAIVIRRPTCRSRGFLSFAPVPVALERLAAGRCNGTLPFARPPLYTL